MPIGRSTSATGVPVSACFSAKVICSSVNLLFFTALLLPSGAHETGKLALAPDQGDGGTSGRADERKQSDPVSAILWARRASANDSREGQALLGYILTAGPNALRDEAEGE